MGPTKQTLINLFGVIRLDSVKNKILAFALLATLIPSLSMGWLSYVYSRRSLTEKIAEALRNATTQTAREIDIWLKERFYDLRVFSGSYEVSENLEQILGTRGAPTTRGAASRRLNDYLSSVREKFIHYEELLVLDPNGQVMATSAGRAGTVNLPPDWLQGARRDKAIVGASFWDPSIQKMIMTIAVPIKAGNARVLGVLAAKVNFRAIEEIVKSFSLGTTGQVYLIGEDGKLVLSSQPIPLPLEKSMLSARAVQALGEREATPLEYPDYQGTKVVGTLRRLPSLGWAVVAEVGQQEAYAPIVRLRNLTVLMVLGLLLGIGLTAYLLGLTIVRPLDHLTTGAAQVAAGDLEVDLPVVSRGEVGYLTEVFNHMVARLRQSRKELADINDTLSEKNKALEALSITDGLTSLYNRSHLMQTLTNEAARARRHKHPFSVLMIDIDHFKKYNDTFGHLAGDAVLSKMAMIFTKSIRHVEYAARYGGEEFLIMLPETDPDGAVEAAERIRTRVAEEVFGDGQERVVVTISIGVAGYPEHGDTPESIIASADAALYQAKRSGRNRVVRATKRIGKTPRGGA